MSAVWADGAEGQPDHLQRAGAGRADRHAADRRRVRLGPHDKMLRPEIMGPPIRWLSVGRRPPRSTASASPRRAGTRSCRRRRRRKKAAAPSAGRSSASDAVWLTGETRPRRRTAYCGSILAALISVAAHRDAVAHWSRRAPPACRPRPQARAWRAAPSPCRTLRIFTSSSLSRATIGAGVPAGAKKPSQDDISKPGTVSRDGRHIRDRRRSATSRPRRDPDLAGRQQRRRRRSS